jgi:hypothetical protein
MHMDVVVKVPQENIIEAAEEFNNFKCLRKEVNFELFGDKWKTDFTCGRYGNGYGVGFSCEDNCPLRITDLKKCRRITTEYSSYLVQDDYYTEEAMVLNVETLYSEKED